MILVGVSLHQHWINIYYHAGRMHSFFCHYSTSVAEHPCWLIT